MRGTDFPALFIASDSAALSSERRHFLVFGSQVVLIVLASGVSGVSRFLEVQRQAGTIRWSAALLMLSILASLFGRIRRFDKQWFDTRAVAESVKSATWRYMMGAPPFSLASPQDSDDENLIQELRKIRIARRELASYFPISGTPVQITEEMRRVRNLPLDAKRQIYLQDRLDDQILWYGRRTSGNRRLAEFWFWSTAFVQALAITLVSFWSSSGLIPLTIVPILGTVATAFLAWNQARGHEELSSAYGLAAQELTELKSLFDRFPDSASFGKFVSQVEESISREHTMWRARRNIPFNAH